MKTRIDWIDIFKALAIISVIIGHSGSQLTPYVYLFHIPAFVFISGFTFNYEKYPKIQDLFFNKFKRLIIPYFSFAFLYSIFQILLKILNVDSVIFSTSTKEFFNPFWLFNSITSVNYVNQLSGASWFLIMIFETTMFSSIMFKIQRKYKINDLFLILFILLLLIIGCNFFYPKWPATHINYFLDLNLVSIFFFISGYLFKKYKIFISLNKKYFIIFFIFILYFSRKHLSIQMDFPNRSFESWINVLISSFSGIFFLYYLSLIIEKLNLIKNIFIYIGKKTLSILCLHFFGFKISFFTLFILGFYKFENIKLLTPAESRFLWIPIVLISLVSSLIITKILSKANFTKTIFLGE